jgi:hypothetical protein
MILEKKKNGEVKKIIEGINDRPKSEKQKWKQLVNFL